MARDSASNTEEPKSLDESKEEEKDKASLSFPDEEEEEYLEVDPNDMEEVDPEDLEGVDFDDLYEVVDEEREKDVAEGPGGEDGSASEKEEPEPDGEAPKEEKKEWKSLLSSSSDEEEEDSEDSDDSEWDDSDEVHDSEEVQEDSGEGGRQVSEYSTGGLQVSKDSTEDSGDLLNKVMEANVLAKDGSVMTLEDVEEQLLNEPDKFDFPEDPEEWREEDLREYWADAPVYVTKPGWDPVWADYEDWEAVVQMEEEGKCPPDAPFYVPYRRPYPVVPDNHRDIDSPKSVIEELDRIEEFLKWVSYIFPDGSS